MVSSEINNPEDPSDVCFLENDRILIVTDHLELFSIEDLSKAPQLLACFLLPIFVTNIAIVYNPRPRMQAQRMTWIADPKDQVISIVVFSPNVVFHVSTRIFFNLDLFRGPFIPWKSWGPLNSRVFHHHWRCGVATLGHRVLQGFPAIHNNMAADDVPEGMEYRLHMMDFSPLAVKRCKGLARVVKEPSTIVLEGKVITTSLPYVGIMLGRTFRCYELIDIWVDQDRIYMFVRLDGNNQNVGSSPFFNFQV